MKNLAKLFLSTLSRLDARILALVKLGYMLDMDRLSIALGARRIAQVIRVDENEANRNRLIDTIDEMRKLYDGLKVDYDLLSTELRWLTSQQYFDGILRRRHNLHGKVDREYREELNRRIRAFDEFRLSDPRLESIRAEAARFDRFLKELEAKSEEIRNKAHQSHKRKELRPYYSSHPAKPRHQAQVA